MMALKLTLRCCIWLEPPIETVDADYGMIYKIIPTYLVSFYQMGTRNTQSTMAVIFRQPSMDNKTKKGSWYAFLRFIYVFYVYEHCV